MNLGTILHDGEFQYDDGTTGNKLAIIVSNFGKNFLAVKTTSQQHRKSKARGCQINDKPPNYFLPKNSTWFKEDTWIQVDEIFELDFNILSSKNEGKASPPVLSQTVMKELLECALQSEEIEEFYLDFLRFAVKSL